MNILKERAKKLAQPIASIDLISKGLEVVAFNLGEESFAIETSIVKEISPLKNYTILPGAPPFVFGLVSIRRNIILIVDLNVLFSISHKNNESKKLLLLEKDESCFALLIDDILEIRDYNPQSLQVSLPTLTGVREEFLKGIAADGTIILDGQKLLTSHRFVLDEENG